MELARGLKLVLVILLSFSLSACGTRDYAPVPAPTTRVIDKSPEVVNTKARDPLRAPPIETSHEGYLFSALKKAKASPDFTKAIRCGIIDSPEVDPFQSLGAAVIGGAGLGVLVRSLGSRLLGDPVKSDASHWLWKRIDVTFKNTWQGIVKGALAGAACQTALAGGNLLPINGVLGADYAAISTAITLSTGTLISASLIGKKMRIGNPPIDPDFSDGVKPWKLAGAVGSRLRPGLSALFAAGGVGWLTFLWLRDFDRDNNVDPDCDSATLEPTLDDTNFHIKK